MIKILFTIVAVAVPGLLLYLNIFYSEVNGRLFFSIFTIFVAIIKIWESFFTTKEREAIKYQGDWTLVFTSSLYLVTGLCIILEFFIINRRLNTFSIIVGILFFALAVILRRWSIKTLGDQWAIHINGPSKLSQENVLIIQGPYKFIRHPIYLTYILDLVGIALMFGAFYSLILIFLVNLPSYIMRAKLEEKTSIERFGKKYSEYKNKTSLMLPLKF